MTQIEKRETLERLLNSSLTRCAWIRERLQRGAEYSEDDACLIREIDDALYKLCLSVQEPCSMRETLVDKD